MLTVYACQINLCWEDKAANFARVTSLLADAGIMPGGLIVLPEMFATGFSMNAEAIAEDINDSETAAYLSSLARQYHCHVLAGMVIRQESEQRPQNTAVLYAPDGRLMGQYAKMYPFTPGGERKHYTPGDAPAVFRMGGLTVAPLICYDLRFPEVFRDAVRLGADAFVVIASWPVARAHHWSVLLRARAIENQAYVVGVNRVGDDPTPLSYPGCSVLIDPSGRVLAEAGDEETVLSSVFDTDFVARYRQELPFLDDRRF